ncbi:MAG: hypothetical protein HYZ49_05800 [Chloroflexi bacterium]|nr:hypothetical protein [Chloroflexota bacterium]
MEGSSVLGWVLGFSSQFVGGLLLLLLEYHIFHPRHNQFIGTPPPAPNPMPERKVTSYPVPAFLLALGCLSIGAMLKTDDKIGIVGLLISAVTQIGLLILAVFFGLNAIFPVSGTAGIVTGIVVAAVFIDRHVDALIGQLLLERPLFSGVAGIIYSFAIIPLANRLLDTHSVGLLTFLLTWMSSMTLWDVFLSGNILVWMEWWSVGVTLGLLLGVMLLPTHFHNLLIKLGMDP